MTPTSARLSIETSQYHRSIYTRAYVLAKNYYGFVKKVRTNRKIKEKKNPQEEKKNPQEEKKNLQEEKANRQLRFI